MSSALNRKAALLATSLLLAPLLVSAQATAGVSADAFFAALSDSYGKVRDYEATLTITRGKVSD
jgi:outer membrane lipoprotein-sorting protein